MSEKQCKKGEGCVEINLNNNAYLPYRSVLPYTFTSANTDTCMLSLCVCELQEVVQCGQPTWLSTSFILTSFSKLVIGIQPNRLEDDSLDWKLLKIMIISYVH